MALDNLDARIRAAMLLEMAGAVERVYMLDDGVPNWPDACQMTAKHLTPDEAAFILRMFGPLVQQLSKVAFPRKNAEPDQTTD